jgi:hypothetical protein
MPASRRVVTAAAVLVAVTVGGAAVAGGRGDGDAAVAAGPTAVAATRDLATTLETTGTVERDWQHTVSHAAALPRPAAGGGSSPESIDDGATAGTPAALTLASTQEAPAPETPPTTVPEVGGETPVTTPPSTTAPEATPPTTGAPLDRPPATPPTTVPVPGATAPTTVPPASAETEPETETEAQTETEQDDPAVLTAVAPPGSEVGTGSVLYAADDEPVVALVGTVPAWRTLDAGVDGGADVRQLEEALVALGHGAGITVDDEFTAGTTAAVKRWETALGRSRPDGVVEVGDVVVVEEAGTVLTVEAAVGDPVEGGTAVLVLGSRAQAVAATVAAGEAAAWAAGRQVDLTWSDGTTTAGTVAGTGKEVTDGAVRLTVTLSAEDATRPTGAEATIAAVDAERKGAVAVPVSALVAGVDGTPAVRRPTGRGEPDAVVPVTIGIVTGTWVEVVAGLDPGDAVRLPG